jgi:hypothetical protein
MSKAGDYTVCTESMVGRHLIRSHHLNLSLLFPPNVMECTSNVTETEDSYISKRVHAWKEEVKSLLCAMHSFSIEPKAATAIEETLNTSSLRTLMHIFGRFLGLASLFPIGARGNRHPSSFLRRHVHLLCRRLAH